MTVTRKDNVIAESRRILALASALAASSERLFGAQIEEADFEEQDGAEYARTLERVRRLLEQAASAARGMEPSLDMDVALHGSRKMEFLRGVDVKAVRKLGDVPAGATGVIVETFLPHFAPEEWSVTVQFDGGARVRLSYGDPGLIPLPSRRA